MTTANTANTATATPLLRIEQPGVSQEEIAAIVAVLTTLGPTPLPAPPTPRSLWARPHHRHPHPHGPGAWRASSLPS